MNFIDTGPASGTWMGVTIAFQEECQKQNRSTHLYIKTPKESHWDFQLEGYSKSGEVTM